MRGQKHVHQNGVDPGNVDQAEPEPAPPKQEPTFAEWQVLLDHTTDEELGLQLTIQHLMFSTESGRAYLEFVTRYRPDLEKYPLDFMQLVATYEALGWLDQLIAEPRLGTDPSFFIWKDIWNDSDAGLADGYKDLIGISKNMEDRAPSEEVRSRLRFVREAIERELNGEVYMERKRALAGGNI